MWLTTVNLLVITVFSHHHGKYFIQASGSLDHSCCTPIIYYIINIVTVQLWSWYDYVTFINYYILNLFTNTIIILKLMSNITTIFTSRGSFYSSIQLWIFVKWVDIMYHFILYVIIFVACNISRMSYLWFYIIMRKYIHPLHFYPYPKRFTRVVNVIIVCTNFTNYVNLSWATIMYNITHNESIITTNFQKLHIIELMVLS